MNENLIFIRFQLISVQYLDSSMVRLGSCLLIFLLKFSRAKWFLQVIDSCTSPLTNLKNINSNLTLRNRCEKKIYKVGKSGQLPQ